MQSVPFIPGRSLRFGRLILGACLLAALVSWARPVCAGSPDQAGPPLPPPGQTLVFDSEEIFLTVRGDTLEVEGYYHLLYNPPDRGPDSLSLFYPFPEDVLLGQAWMVSLEQQTRSGAWRPMRYEPISPRLSGVRWWFGPEGPGEIVLRGVYRQLLKSNYARYIVTTTQAWNRPLRRARFEVLLPPGTRPVRFSYPFAEVAERPGLYRFEAEDFLPEKDIVVQWTRR